MANRYVLRFRNPAASVAADAGAYALTGAAADLRVGRRLGADAGSYTITGTDATLTESGGSDFTPLFTSRWESGTGGTDAVVLDSSNTGWDRFWSPSAELMTVLAPASLPGAACPFPGNILRTEDTSLNSHGPGDSLARNIEKDFSPTAGEDLYIAYGYRVDSDGVSSVSHHECPVIAYRNCCPHTPETTTGFYRPVLRQEGGTGSTLPGASGPIPYPFFRFIVPNTDGVRLSLGVWYRHEFRIEIVGRQGVEATRVGTNWTSAWGETGQVEFRIHPRIFVGTGTTPVITAANYQSLDYPSDGGQTLAEFYAAGRTFVTSNTFVATVDGDALANIYKFGLGNNGANSGTGGPGDYWYYANFRAGTGGWPTEI